MNLRSMAGYLHADLLCSKGPVVLLIHVFEFLLQYSHPVECNSKSCMNEKVAYKFLVYGKKTFDVCSASPVISALLTK